MAGGVVDDLLRRRLVILTGKGGVGKSTTSAALALIAAGRRMRVLLVEVDAKGNLPDFFGAPPVGFKPRRLHNGIYGMSMQPKESMQEYLNIYLRIPGFSLRPLQGFMEYVSGAIPGLKEMLVTGKIAWEVKAADDGKPRWDIVIVDAAPTGHVVSQLGAARHLSELVKSGPIHDQAEWMADIFADQERCAVVLVAIPEEMPATETIDLAHRFKVETDIHPAALVINQLQPEIVSPDLLPAFERLMYGEGRENFIHQHPEGEPLISAARIMLEARERAQRYTRMLEGSLRLPTLRVPQLFQRKHSLSFTRSLAEAMEAAS